MPSWSQAKNPWRNFYRLCVVEKGLDHEVRPHVDDVEQARRMALAEFSCAGRLKNSVRDGLYRRDGHSIQHVVSDADPPLPYRDASRIVQNRLLMFALPAGLMGTGLLGGA